MKSSIFAEAKPLVKNWIMTGESFHNPTAVIILTENKVGMPCFALAEDPDFTYRMSAEMMDIVNKYPKGTAFLGYEVSEFAAEDNPEESIGLITAIGPKL